MMQTGNTYRASFLNAPSAEVQVQMLRQAWAQWGPKQFHEEFPLVKDRSTEIWATFDMIHIKALLMPAFHEEMRVRRQTVQDESDVSNMIIT